MADKSQWYSWTYIKYVDKDGNPQTAAPGVPVSANKLNCSHEEFGQLVESKAIRTMAFPDIPANWHGSPLDFVLKSKREEIEMLQGIGDQENEVYELDPGEEPPTAEELAAAEAADGMAPMELDEFGNPVSPPDPNATHTEVF